MGILVAGSATFIGVALPQRVLARGDHVHGIDNHNSYCDPDLRPARLAQFASRPNYAHQQADLADRAGLDRCFSTAATSRFNCCGG